MNRSLTLFVPLLGLLVGCQPPSDHGQFPSEQGRWTLELDTEWPTGWVDIDVLVLTPDELPQPGLELTADLTMPSMGHGSDEPITVSELGEGTYRVHGHFQMEGPWELSGALTGDEASDDFAVALDVVSE